MQYYKLYKILLEDEYYEDVSLLAKVAYGIYVDMLENGYNVKIDSEGKKYINDARKKLSEELNLSVATITKIHKELVEADLIEEKWQGMHLPYMTYIKNYETIELEATKKDIDEDKEIEEVLNLKNLEFSDFNINDSKEIIGECIGEFPYINVSRILKNTNLDLYSERDVKMIKYAIAYMDNYYSNEENDYEYIIECIDEGILDEALSKTKKSKSIDVKACILAHNIFELVLEKYKNDNN